MDGNTSGAFGSGSVSHTESARPSWWQGDLGRPVLVDNVEVRNRTDCCSEPLSDFYLFVSNDPFS
ncbi:MAG: Endo,4-beta-xylanase [Myxococcales bacterium]|nr:Endo,4-beta-xylanase [Myxococcales bacterium]